DAIAGVGAWVGKALPNLDALGEKLQDFYKGVAVTTGSIAVGAGIAVGALVGVGKAMENFVAKANPGAILLFQMALDDLMAIVGQALVPVFLLVTELIRAAADTLSTFAKDIGNAVASVLRPFVEILKVVFEVVGRVGQMIAKAAEAVAPALAALGEVLLAVFKALQPVLDLVVNVIGGALAGVLKVLADVVQAVVPYVVALVDVFALMLKTVVGWVRDILSLVGLDIPDAAGTAPGSSVGASVKQTQVGSVESFLQSAQTKAFALGTAGGSDPTARTASAAESMKIQIEEIKKAITGFPDKCGQWVKDIINALDPTAPGAVAGKGGFLDRNIAEPVSDAADWVERKWKEESRREGFLGFTSINPFS
ncbi:MAG: hypothetical protein EBV68_00470, partial [Betaproteobacteria bacterium]|nr:hypothetical protein [Betaproteobacteria bacterium]